MMTWHWIIRAVAVAPALWLFVQWHSIGAQWPALFSWLVCVGGAELIIEASRAPRERRRKPNLPRRGGQRHSDPPPG